jgi:hypothetical protein
MVAISVSQSTAVIEIVRDSCPSLVKVFADGGYAGEKLRTPRASDGDPRWWRHHTQGKAQFSLP